ncbi:hypothetical protein GCM10009863_52000 [Streptomyces axinellae]|uniref:Transposase n=1 Tax=Streptomyces axinellae TaxID=552788 RepID=A0ABN3QM43_9ACTN
MRPQPPGFHTPAAGASETPTTQKRKGRPVRHMIPEQTTERDFARCSQRWDAARNFRQFRTDQQDKAASSLTARLARLFRGGAR